MKKKVSFLEYVKFHIFDLRNTSLCEKVRVAVSFHVTWLVNVGNRGGNVPSTNFFFFTVLLEFVKA